MPAGCWGHPQLDCSGSSCQVLGINRFAGNLVGNAGKKGLSSTSLGLSLGGWNGGFLWSSLIIPWIIPWIFPRMEGKGVAVLSPSTTLTNSSCSLSCWETLEKGFRKWWFGYAHGYHIYFGMGFQLFLPSCLEHPPGIPLKLTRNCLVDSEGSGCSCGFGDDLFWGWFILGMFYFGGVLFWDVLFWELPKLPRCRSHLEWAMKGFHPGKLNFPSVRQRWCSKWFPSLIPWGNVLRTLRRKSLLWDECYFLWSQLILVVNWEI